MSQPDVSDPVLKTLKRPLRLTRVGMVAERLVRAFWPSWSLALLAIVPLALGLQNHVPIFVVLVFLLGVATLLGLTLWRGAQQFVWPTSEEAQARLDETLPGRPIAALLDDQAIGKGDAATQMVWQVHQRRMAARASTARAVHPDLQLASRDRFGLRYIALTTFAAAATFGSIWQVATITDLPETSGAAQALGPAWEGWAEPPAYTGRPGLYLNDIIAPVLELPQDTQITLRLYGEDGRASVTQNIAGDEHEVTEDGASHLFRLARSGEMQVGDRDWQVLMQRDFPPMVEVTAPQEFGPAGEIRQRYEPSDDYGVVAGKVVISLDLGAIERSYGLAVAPEERDPIELDLPMPLVGDRTAFEGILIENFSEHPWARMPVLMRFEVRDALDQRGLSAAIPANLGGQRFFDPLAKAIAELRRDLLWSRENGKTTAQLLRAISHLPDGLFRDSAHYLKLRHAIRQLEEGVKGGLTTERRDEVAQVLWELAQELEFGDLDDARERLERAQERLAEAMRNGADPAEINELMQELREAMNDYLRQLAQEQRQEGGDQQTAQNGEANEVTQDQLQEMMNKIQELMEEGRMAEAMALMEQLMELMENLRITEGQGGEGQPSPGQQALDGLREGLRNQQGLSDDTFRDLQDQFNPNAGREDGRAEGQPRPGETPGGREQSEQQGEGAGDQRSLAERQSDLREQLQELQQQMPGLGGETADEIQDSLNNADRAMNRAERDLLQGDLPGALDNQAEAMNDMRDAIRGLGQALAQQQQEQQGEGAGDPQQAQQGGPRDPLGRGESGDGPNSDGSSLRDGDVILGERAQELLDEIQRRSLEQNRPDLELDYLKRLLDRF
ncbi:hypothetical protein ATO10_13264 [Actibacterium atlanticum]|uniref:TIGR02302 family protein n=1 Tax=Actibacterium atlanticum TaxID=1461693 RepID=A0A058ZIY4_9RHOB|nr:DUF4175 domain-containing protein [Actibacterium atlanticum]KCV81152.1 hypothetical protein ATO10_13264 [Actibacterium atlanticum]